MRGGGGIVTKILRNKRTKQVCDRKENDWKFKEWKMERKGKEV